MTIFNNTSAGSDYSVTIVNRPSTLNISSSLLEKNSEAAVNYLGQYITWKGTLDFAVEVDVNDTKGNWTQNGAYYVAHGGIYWNQASASSSRTKEL